MPDNDDGIMARVRETLKSIGAQLNEQEWFQQLKGKWEELDPQSRLYLKYGSAGAAILMGLLMVISSVSSVYSLKSEIAEKTDLLNLIRTANEELSNLRRQTGGARISVGKDKGIKKEINWKQYLEKTAVGAGMSKDSLVVSTPKPGQSGELATESLLDVKLTKVSIKQVVRYAFQLENGTEPVKLRHLTIDTLDAMGYLDANFSLSAFTLK